MSRHVKTWLVVYNCVCLFAVEVCSYHSYWRPETPVVVQSNPQPWGNREKCIILNVRNLTYMCLVSADHTHTRVVWVKQLEAEDWESALNSSNLHGNVMSALPFDHRKCVPTKGLTPALLKIRIRFYNYYQLQSAARQQMLHTGVLMWMAVGISQTKDFTLCDSKWKEHQRNTL